MIEGCCRAGAGYNRTRDGRDGCGRVMKNGNCRE
jgi:hypothetical protein